MEINQGSIQGEDTSGGEKTTASLQGHILPWISDLKKQRELFFLLHRKTQQKVTGHMDT